MEKRWHFLATILCLVIPSAVLVQRIIEHNWFSKYSLNNCSMDHSCYENCNITFDNTTLYNKTISKCIGNHTIFPCFTHNNSIIAKCDYYAYPTKSVVDIEIAVIVIFYALSIMPIAHMIWNDRRSKYSGYLQVPQNM